MKKSSYSYQAHESHTLEEDKDSCFFENKSQNCCVKAAVRIRPFLREEVESNEMSCVKADADNNMVIIGMDRAFSFDRVFDTDSTQEDIFEICAKNLLLSAFSGYNSTIFAYGQTCSGKTYTMGTNTTSLESDFKQGIIPRAVKMIFDEIENRRSKMEFTVKVSFIEIYNEEIRDLLDPQGQSKIVVREFSRGVPSLCGQQEVQVVNSETILSLLEMGAVNRMTRTTIMNEYSSRSHAILEVNIEQHPIEDLSTVMSSQINGNSHEFIKAKFHFVDLAGSERIKKSGLDEKLFKKELA